MSNKPSGHNGLPFCVMVNISRRVIADFVQVEQEPWTSEGTAFAIVKPNGDLAPHGDDG